jgi:alpha-beta hydrolase superfamily lysophospholipase
MSFTSPEKGKEVYFTGHSLGGVIACFAALDFTMYSKDRIDKFSRHQKLRLVDIW